MGLSSDGISVLREGHIVERKLIILKGTIYKPGREMPPETNPARLVWDFQPQKISDFLAT